MDWKSHAVTFNFMENDWTQRPYNCLFKLMVDLSINLAKKQQPTSISSTVNVYTNFGGLDGYFLLCGIPWPCRYHNIKTGGQFSPVVMHTIQIG